MDNSLSQRALASHWSLLHSNSQIGIRYPTRPAWHILQLPRSTLCASLGFQFYRIFLNISVDWQEQLHQVTKSHESKILGSIFALSIHTTHHERKLFAIRSLGCLAQPLQGLER
ncbi:hypothetical protein FGO68_gene14751 [Halteria grandinella]|uniref:Uncharacterized protein n=1 Tax=Halteria grandinella TaxID=5974 RepID=A0A8J8N959_HALGN|nr:hypothetical protein FGO68_gene14751 [Halteria grandinella]